MIDDPVLPDDEFDESGIRGAAALGQEPNDAEPDADSDDVDVISGDMPNTEQPMVLPEMDFTQQAPPAAPPAALRLRAPDSSGKAPAAGPTPLPPRAPAPSPKDMDWKQLGDALFNAEFAAKGSRDAEHLFANAANSGDYKERTDYSQGPKMAALPMEMNAQRQASEGRELGLQSQKAAQGVKAAMDDPNSLQSQKARDAVRSMGLQGLPAGFDNYSANDISRFVKTGELARIQHERAAVEDDARKAVAAQQKAQGAEAEKQRQIALHEKERAEDLKHRREMEKIGWAAAARAENPKLPPGQLAEVADYDTAAKSADDLLQNYEQAGLDGLLSRAAGAVSDSTGADLGDVSQYNDKANTAAQTIGLALEGGKLGEADLPRYRAMLPKAGDSIERARAKRDNVKRALADKAAGRSVEWFKAGYKVPGGGESGGGHGAVIKETKSFRRYADGYVEEK